MFCKGVEHGIYLWRSNEKLQIFENKELGKLKREIYNIT
jgi:hypothetical protein